jgi:hypothetical protein
MNDEQQQAYFADKDKELMRFKDLSGLEKVRRTSNAFVCAFVNTKEAQGHEEFILGYALATICGTDQDIEALAKVIQAYRMEKGNA